MAMLSPPSIASSLGGCDAFLDEDAATRRKHLRFSIVPDRLNSMPSANETSTPTSRLHRRLSRLRHISYDGCGAASLQNVRSVCNPAFWNFLCHVQSQVEQAGCSLHDLIQPSVSFLAGVALPFSIANRAARRTAAPLPGIGDCRPLIQLV